MWAPVEMAKYRRRLKTRRENKKIAVERISILFGRARKIFGTDPELAQRYVDLARKIGMRYKVRIPVQFRGMICKKCKGFIVPGKNCRVRIRQEREPHVVITCLNCNGRTRIPLKKYEY